MPNFASHGGQPFLRWAGSKRQQLARLGAFWTDDHKRYIEPFCGSACLFFKLAPSKAVLGDNNADLIELFQVVKDSPELLYKKFYRLKRDAETYYRWRAKEPSKLDTITRAARFLYLNRNCFNGIYRTNSAGQFNVPMGKKLGLYFSLEDMMDCSLLLQRTKLIAGDFTKTIKGAKSGDLVYLDPPFALKSRRVFAEYGASSFQTEDIVRLSEALQIIQENGADFLVSYADCTEARGVAKEWNSIRLPVRRCVAGFAGNRRQAYEWLITNRPIPNVLRKTVKR